MDKEFEYVFKKEKEEYEEKDDDFFQTPNNASNLLIFIILGITVSFTYYLLNFYSKYMKASIYTISIANSIAEMLANIFVLFLSKRVSAKKGFVISFIFTAVASTFLLLSTSIKSIRFLIPLFVLIAKGGITLAFCYVFFAPL